MTAETAHWGWRVSLLLPLVAVLLPAALGIALPTITRGRLAFPARLIGWATIAAFALAIGWIVALARFD